MNGVGVVVILGDGFTVFGIGFEVGVDVHSFRISIPTSALRPFLLF